MGGDIGLRTYLHRSAIADQDKITKLLESDQVMYVRVFYNSS